MTGLFHCYSNSSCKGVAFSLSQSLTESGPALSTIICYIYPGAPGTERGKTGYYNRKRAHIHARVSFHAPYTHFPFLDVYQNTFSGRSLRHIHGFMAATLLTMSAALAPGQDDFLALLKPSLSEGFQEDSSLFSFEAKNPDTERGISNDYSQVNCFYQFSEWRSRRCDCITG